MKKLKITLWISFALWIFCSLPSFAQQNPRDVWGLPPAQQQRKPPIQQRNVPQPSSTFEVKFKSTFVASNAYGTLSIGGLSVKRSSDGYYRFNFSQAGNYSYEITETSPGGIQVIPTDGNGKGTVYITPNKVYEIKRVSKGKYDSNRRGSLILAIE